MTVKYITVKGPDRLAREPFYMGIPQHDRTLSRREFYDLVAGRTGYRPAAWCALGAVACRYAGDASATSPAVPKCAWLSPRTARQSKDCLRVRVRRHASLRLRLARLSGGGIARPANSVSAELRRGRLVRLSRLPFAHPA